MCSDAPTLPTNLGDLDTTVAAIANGDHVDSDYNHFDDYGLVKLIGIVGMRHLSEQYGLRALAVSPGYTAGTQAMNKLPKVEEILAKNVMTTIMQWLGNAHAIEVGAARYVQALENPSFTAGEFYASKGSATSGSKHH